VLSALAVLVLVSGYRTQWWAGHTYGPRFMTEALPFLLPVTVAVSLILVIDGVRRVPQRAVVGAVVVVWALAFAVHWQGAWFHSTQCWNGAPRSDIDTDPGRIWSVSDAQLTSGWRTLFDDGPAKALWTACLDSNR
jgi:hypothetical protein